MNKLHKKYPSYNVGRHISTALSDYGDAWGMTDKEFLFALTKYEATLDIDFPLEEQSYVDKIVKDGMNLSSMLDDDYQPEEEY